MGQAVPGGCSGAGLPGCSLPPAALQAHQGPHGITVGSMGWRWAPCPARSVAGSAAAAALSQLSDPRYRGSVTGGLARQSPSLNGNLFAGMLRKLEIKKEDDLQAVCEVAAHVFNDGVTNWGRVVTLISFGAFVAKHLKSINQEKCITSLAGIITDALVSSKREWLMSQGGWVSHCPPRGFQNDSVFPISVTHWVSAACVSEVQMSHCSS